MKQFVLLFVIFLVQNKTSAFSELGVDLFHEEVLLRTKRQSDGSEKRVTYTDLCPKAKFQEFLSDMEVCFTNSITKFLDEYVWDGSDLDNDRVLCNKYLDQSKCYTEGGPKGLKCWDNKEAQNRKINFLYDNHRKITVNGTSEDGKLFVDSCIAFANFEKDFMVRATGCQSCCTFDEFHDKKDAWNNCLDESLLQVEQRRKLAYGIGGTAGR